MNSTRPYSTATRDRITKANRQRVREAVVELAGEVRLADITLQLVAEASQLSVRTLLRYYGSRAGMLETVAAELDEAPLTDARPVYPGDIDASVRSLVADYEATGRSILKLLTQEDEDPVAAHVTNLGRAQHRNWVAAAFDTPADDPAQAAVVDLLVVSTDLYTWKLLRLDRGLSQSATVERMTTLVDAVLQQLGPARQGTP